MFPSFFFQKNQQNGGLRLIMLDEDKYFLLFSNCIPVRGAKRSIICDLQRGQYWFISTSLYDLLSYGSIISVKESKRIFKDNSLIDVNYGFLIENELGFYCSLEETKLFPKIDLTWEDPSIINNAIIDYDGSHQHDYKEIFHELEELGCKHIQLRFFSFIDPLLFNKILSFLEGKRIVSVEIIIPFCNGEFSDEIISISCKQNRIFNIVFHNSPHSKSLNFNGLSLRFIEKHFDSSSHCGAISKNYFSVNIDAFTESVNFNSCLNKKISIDVMGNIKNCPSMNLSFGHLSANSLLEVAMRIEFKEIWDINKDQIKICSHCEFRYICSDCRAFIKSPDDIYSKPLKCSYNPYIAEWGR